MFRFLPYYRKKKSLLILMDYVSIITVLVIAFIMYFIITNITKFEHSIEIKKKKNDGEEKSVFTRFAIKNTNIAGSLAFVIGLKTRDLIQSLLDSVINPFFKDKKRINKITKLFQITLFGLKFSFTDFVLDFIKYFMFMIFVYLIVIAIYTQTNFIDL